MRRRRLICGALAHLLILLGAIATIAQAKTTYNVLTFVSMTIGGRPIAGKDVVASYAALIIAAKHFNERNSSILNVLGTLGRCDAQLRLFGGLFDDQVKSNVAMAHLMQAVSNHTIHFLNGPLSTDVVQTVGMTAGSLGLPLISYQAASEKLSDKALYPTTFRIIPTDLQPIVDLVQLIVEFGYVSIGLVYTAAGYGENFQTLLQTACSARGIRLSSVSITAGQTRGQALDSSMLEALHSLVEQKRQVVLRALVTVDEEVAYAKAALRLNWTVGKLHITRPQITLKDIFNTASADDAIFLRRFYDGTFSVSQLYNSSTPAYRSFVRAWKTQDVLYVNSFLASKTAPNNQSLLFPEDYFSHSIDGYLTFGMAYDSMIALGLAACGSSSNLMENLRNVRFAGISGKIWFNDKLNRYGDIDGVYTFLENVVADPTAPIGVSSRVVGYVRGGNWSINNALLRFSDGTSTPPPDTDRPPLTIHRISLGLRVWGGIEAVLAIILSLASFGKLLFEARTRENLRLAHGIAHLVVMSLGSILLAISIGMLIIESDGTCMAFYWLFFLGLCMIVAGVTAEAVRIRIIRGRTPIALLDNESSMSGSNTAMGNNNNERRVVRPVQAISKPTTVQWEPEAFLSGPDATNLTASGMPQQPPNSEFEHPACSRDDIKLIGLPAAVIVVQTLSIFVVMLYVQIVAPLHFGLAVSERDANGYAISASATCMSLLEKRSVILTIFITLICLIAAFTVAALVAALSIRSTQNLKFRSNKVVIIGFCEFQIFFTGLPLAVAVAQTAAGGFLVTTSIAFSGSLVVSIALMLPVAIGPAKLSLPSPSGPPSGEQASVRAMRSDLDMPLTTGLTEGRNMRPLSGPSTRGTGLHRSAAYPEYSDGVERNQSLDDDWKSSSDPMAEDFNPSKQNSFFEPLVTHPPTSTDGRPRPSAGGLGATDFARLNGPPKRLPSFVVLQQLQATPDNSTTRSAIATTTTVVLEPNLRGTQPSNDTSIALV